MNFDEPATPPDASPRGSGVVFLLVGLTGSGKTTYAKKLETNGVIRLSPDEIVFARHGRYGVDYPEADYFGLEAPVVAEVDERLVEAIAAGRSVVLDHGLWTRSARDAYKKLIESAGGTWRLLYFEVGHDELLRRLDERNQRSDANALFVTPSALADFIARFEVPGADEGAEVVYPSTS